MSLVAAGNVEDYASIFKANGDQVKTGGAPPLLFSRPPERFDPLNYVEGEPPANPQEVAINKGTADKENLKVGDKVSLVGPHRAGRTSRSRASRKFGDVSSLGGATVVRRDPAGGAAARGPARQGRLDPGRRGARRETGRSWSLASSARLPDTVEVKTGEEDADENTDSIKNSLSFLNTLLLVFAGIALFVGAFIIFNTFSITVAQRTREFALLRTMGASRRQVLRSVLLEALIVGLSRVDDRTVRRHRHRARGINALFKAFGADLPQEGLVLEPRTVIVALLVGHDRDHALQPRAGPTRDPRAAAGRDARGGGDPAPPTRRRRTVLVVGAAGRSASALIAARPVRRQRAGSRSACSALGAILLFIAIALLSPRLVPPIAGAVGYPLERLRGVAGRLARENAAAQPEPHRGDRGRADDRARAGHVRVGPGGGSEGVDRRHRQQGHEGAVRRAEQGRVLSDQPGDRPGDEAGARRADGLPAEHVRRPRWTASAAHAVRERHRPATFDKVWNLTSTRARRTSSRRSPPRGIVLEKNWAEDNSFDLGDTVHDRPPRSATSSTSRCRGRSTTRAASSATSSCRTAVDQAGIRPARRLRRVRRRPARRRPESGPGSGSTGSWKQRFPIAEAQSQKEFKDNITGTGEPVPLPDLRAAVAVDDRLAVRDREHAGAVDPRAHARDRHDARDRDAAAACPADRALRVRDHGADRRGARASRSASSWAW